LSNPKIQKSVLSIFQFNSIIRGGAAEEEEEEEETI
jgi:hypothetical protein